MPTTTETTEHDSKNMNAHGETVRIKTLIPHYEGAIPVLVEVDLLRRLPSIVIVGLPGGIVRAASDRIRDGVVATKLPTGGAAEFPRCRVVINVRPDDNDDTSGFSRGLMGADAMDYLEAAIVYGILVASGQVPKARPFSHMEAYYIGRIALGGTLIMPPHMARILTWAEDLEDLVTIRTGATNSNTPGFVPAGLLCCPARVHVYGSPTVLGFNDGAHTVRPGYLTLDTSEADDALDAARLMCGPQLAVMHTLMERRPLAPLVLVVNGATNGVKQATGHALPALAGLLLELRGPLDEDQAVECIRAREMAGLPMADAAHHRSVQVPRRLRAPHHSVSYASLQTEYVASTHGLLLIDDADCFHGDKLRMVAMALDEGAVWMPGQPNRHSVPARGVQVLAVVYVSPEYNNSDMARVKIVVDQLSHPHGTAATVLHLSNSGDVFKHIAPAATPA
jgi:hypothetical protein